MDQDVAQLARKIADIAADHKAEDILLLDMRPASYVADYFVLCTGTSDRQIRALADEIREALAKDGQRPLHIEGTAESGWILMDYGAVVVHIFSQEERAYYGLDRLWREAIPLLHMQ
ncbi:MAG: ribosome silencing factor [Chloroflexota bacterium]